MATRDILAIQKRLKALGFDPGPLDGKSGKRTTAAIKSFQVANGLAADGKVGPRTESKLWPDATIARDEGAPIQEPSTAKFNQWPLQKDCMRFYGGVGTHQTSLAVPFEMRLAWDKSVIVRKFSIHEKVHDSALRVFNGIASTYSEAERKDLGLNLFGGCLNVRLMRGGSSYSMHSWGVAIDFDPERNGFKTPLKKSRLGQPDANDFWALWEAEGWISLGRARGYDPMHVQAARL